MSSAYINAGYPTGYTASGINQYITIGPTATIGGSGLTGGSSQAYTIVNLGTIDATNASANGITLEDGGKLFNYRL